MKHILQQDIMKLNDTFETTTETFKVVKGSGFVREGDEFNSWTQFQAAYGEAAGVRLNNRRLVEKYLSRIGLSFVEQDDTKTIAKIGDEVGNMLYDFYLQNDEPAISRMNNTWQGESRELINHFLREKPWEKMEGRLRYSDYGLSRGTANAIFAVKPETRLFEITEADFEVRLSEGCLWTVDRAYKVVGNQNPRRADITCSCGKQMKMYRVDALENGRLSCNSCANRTTDFNSFYQLISDEKYTVVKDFEDTRPTSFSRIILQCPNPSHQPYSTHQNRWMSGRRCSACSMRHVGEKKVKEFLEERGIPFDWQVEFDGLLGTRGGQLSYDFMIKLNGENVLLEIDGAGHFEPTAYGGDIETSEQDYLRQIEHDRRKTDFAVQKGLRLVRIQNINSNYDFITDSLEAILSGSETNHFGSLYQENESK